MEIHHGVLENDLRMFLRSVNTKTFDMDTPKHLLPRFWGCGKGTIKLDRTRVYAYSSSHPYQISSTKSGDIYMVFWYLLRFWQDFHL